MTGGRTGMTEGEPLSVMPDGSPITNVGDKRHRASSILSLPRHPGPPASMPNRVGFCLDWQRANPLLSPALHGVWRLISGVWGYHLCPLVQRVQDKEAEPPRTKGVSSTFPNSFWPLCPERQKMVLRITKERLRVFRRAMRLALRLERVPLKPRRLVEGNMPCRSGQRANEFQKFIARLLLLAKHPKHVTRHGQGVLFLDASHHHAQMPRLNDHAHSQGV